MANIFDYVSDSSCYGCEACYETCPVNAIVLEHDQEGFCYPRIDNSKCVNCSLCVKVCPAASQDNLNKITHNRLIYAAYIKDQDQLKKSASGGVAFALMKHFVKQGYHVFGVRYEKDFFGASYAEETDEKGLFTFQGSKYIQAAKKDTYKRIKKLIQKEKNVLFIGLPCEVAALKLFLGEDSQYLLTVELICHGVTSPKVHLEYVNHVQRYYCSQIKSMSVRSKERGWSNPSLQICMENGAVLSKLFSTTAYGYAFYNLSRPSCYQCKYKGDSKVADITIGDYWGCKKEDSIWNEKGISVVFLHTEKGVVSFQQLRNVVAKEINFEQGIKNNSLINKPREKGIREKYAAIFSSVGIFQARRKTETAKMHVIRILRQIKYFRINQKNSG